MQKKSKIILTLVITLFVFSMLSVVSYAKFYNERQPNAIGLHGCYYVQYTGFTPPYGTGNNMLCWVIIPSEHKEHFGFDGQGNLINLTSSTITTRLIASNRAVYVVRALSLEKFQVRSQNSPYTYTDVVHSTGFADTNLHFIGDKNPLNNNIYSNDNFNVSDGENLIFVALLVLIIFEVVNLFAYRRLKSH